MKPGLVRSSICEIVLSTNGRSQRISTTPRRAASVGIWCGGSAASLIASSSFWEH